MQTLEYELNNAKHEKRDYAIPNGATGVIVRVEDGKEDVVLVVDSRAISLTIQGARDLALALRQSANRVERDGWDRAGTLRKGKR